MIRLCPLSLLRALIKLSRFYFKAGGGILTVVTRADKTMRTGAHVRKGLIIGAGLPVYRQVCKQTPLLERVCSERT